MLGGAEAWAGELCGRIQQGMSRLRAAGLGAFHIWMFDQPWQLLLGAWPQAEALLGGAANLVPQASSTSWAMHPHAGPYAYTPRYGVTSAADPVGRAGECMLEPTCAAYQLDCEAAARRNNRYSGTNFGLPHRDYTYSDSHAADGTPNTLTVWVPLTDVTVDSSEGSAVRTPHPAPFHIMNSR